MDFFVERGSVVRQIWGKSDTILFIFAGASAEFALNKAVDWLYFTGQLPSDPLGRLFSTVNYARLIVFSDRKKALSSIDKIAAIHSAVENKRAAKIPDWAYRDVLFMLIDYSIRAFELLERKLTAAEKEEVFDVFYRVGQRMQINGLPENFREWQKAREEHLSENLMYSSFTADLYRQYEKHLGRIRFKLLKEAQILVVPEKVNRLLQLGSRSVLSPMIQPYKISRKLKLDHLIKAILLSAAYKEQIKELDV